MVFVVERLFEGQRLLSRRDVYHLSPKIKGVKKGNLQVIGVRHGQGPHSVGYDVGRYVGDFLDGRKMAVFSEGSPYNFVPAKYWEVAEKIEPPFMAKLTQNTMVKFRADRIAALKNGASYSPTVPPRVAKRQVGGVTRVPFSRRQQKDLDLGFADSFKFRVVPPEIKFLSTVRSALMAGEFLRRTNNGKKPAVLVTGLGHSSQIHHFLENPGRAARYLSMADRKYAEMLKTTRSAVGKLVLKDLRTYISLAKQAFEKQEQSQ